MHSTNPRAAELRRLIATLHADRQAVALLGAEIEAALIRWEDGLPSTLEVAGLALTLHHMYTAVEHALQKVAETLDRASYSGEAWHRELLNTMGVELPGIRKAVLGSDTLRLLDELRGFRHVVRHAYEYQLNVERVQALADQMTELMPMLERDFAELLADLDLRMEEVGQ